VWRHFEALSAIPRPSGQEARVREHVVAFARSLNLPVVVDDIGNVIIKKPASPIGECRACVKPCSGMGDRRGVVLQAHLDMVPQKAADSSHDFSRDPIRPRIVGEPVKATGTTLGADNGIGIATALAVLESTDIPHPPLELLFTIDEEAGVTGARGLKAGLLDGAIPLNLDSEDEGELCIGCAGGADFKVNQTFATAPVTAGSTTTLRLDVGGLRGGHSGVDIHLGRGNANVILARLLDAAVAVAPVRLARLSGGTLRNAIPRNGTATVVVDAAAAVAVRGAIGALGEAIRRELRDTDPDVTIAVVDDVAPATAMAAADSARLVAALVACPHGVSSMVRDMPEVTETSNNLAIVEVQDGRLAVTCMLRSSVESKKQAVSRILLGIFSLLGATCEVTKGYPGWQPNTSSPVLAMLPEVFGR